MLSLYYRSRASLSCRVVAAVLLTVVGAAVTRAEEEGSGGIPAEVAAQLERQAEIVHAAAVSDGNAGIRGTLRFALEAAGNDWNPAAVEEALRLARSMQDTDQASPHFGNYRWRKNDAAVTDLNAVEFATTLTALLRLDHADRLTPSARELLDLMNRDAVVGLRNHEVGPGYTNIYLKKVWCHLALGQVAGGDLVAGGDPAAGGDLVETGRRLWNAWLDHTRTEGLREYLSPTYYGVTLDSLGLIHRHAADAAIRHEAERALELVWTSIAANWFAPAERLSGPHGRDYDYLFGRGYLDEHLADAGWLTRPPAFDGGGWLAGAPHSALTVLRKARRWDPPAALREGPCGELPRFVVQRFNHAPWGRATNWVGRECAIGIAGECVGPEDKTLAISLPGGFETPNVALVFDGRGDPYGRIRGPAGFDGHRKSHHLRPFVIASQRGPKITAAWYHDPHRPLPGSKSDPLDCLQAHLIMPADAEVWSATAPLADDAALPAAGVVFLRKAGVAVGIRSVVDAAAGWAPTGLVMHADGGKAPAKRLTALFSDTPPTRAALLVLDIEAREGCDDADFAQFRGEFAARPVTATLAEGRLRVEGSLPLEADLWRSKRIACEPELSADTLLRVNDHELGRPLLEGFATPAGPAE